MNVEERKQVVVPDSPEARRLALLGEYHADLVEAESTFELAESFTGETEPPGSDIYRFLVAHGVVAYARCFTTSNVRAKLDTILQVPAEHASTHKALIDFRNRTVAHSESSLQVTYAVVDLLRVEDETTVERAMSITLANGAPRSVIAEAQRLIADLLEALQALRDVAKAEVVASLDAAAADWLWENGGRARFVPTPEEEWAADTRRSKYPSSPDTPIYMGNKPAAG